MKLNRNQVLNYRRFTIECINRLLQYLRVSGHVRTVRNPGPAILLTIIQAQKVGQEKLLWVLNNLASQIITE